VSTQPQLPERGHHGLQHSSQTSHHVDTQHISSLRASRRRGLPTVPMSTPHGQAEPAQNAGVLMDQLDAGHVAPSPSPFYVFRRRPGETPVLPDGPASASEARTVRSRSVTRPHPGVNLGLCSGRSDDPPEEIRPGWRHAVTLLMTPESVVSSPFRTAGWARWRSSRRPTRTADCGSASRWVNRARSWP